MFILELSVEIAACFLFDFFTEKYEGEHGVESHEGLKQIAETHSSFERDYRKQD